MSYQREYTRRIKAAVIGLGDHSYRNILPLMHFLPVQLEAVCDPNESLLRPTAAEFGCRAYTASKEMYENEKLDAVFIVVGPRQHPQLVLEALEAGLHVWVEKPIAVRAEQIEQMIAKRNKAIVVAGLKKAFMPASQKAAEIIASPDYGNLQSLLAVYPMTIEQNGEELLEKGETPNWLRNGVHPLSFLLSSGGKPRAVTTITGPKNNGVVTIEFESGVMATLHLASGSKPDKEYYGVFGEGWSLHIQDTNVCLQRGIPGFIYSKTNNFAPAGFESGSLTWTTPNCVATLENHPLFIQGFYDETKYFCDCILENRQPQKGTLEFAHEIMKVYEAALISHGKRIVIV